MDCWTRETEESHLHDKESQSLDGCTLSGPLVDTRGHIASARSLLLRDKRHPSMGFFSSLEAEYALSPLLHFNTVRKLSQYHKLFHIRGA